MSTASRPHTKSGVPPLAEKPRTSLNRWLRPLIDRLPAVIVFLLLAVVFLIGHETGWKLPSLSALSGGGTSGGEEWCAEHSVPEAECVECQDGLVEKLPSFGFCRTHGVAECVICHPELAQVRGEPKLPSYDTAAAIGVMERNTNNSRNNLNERLVQFATAESATKAGVMVNVVQEEPMTDAVSANGEIQFDPTRVAHLSSRAPGTVAQVFKIVGDEVHAGEVLSLVDVAAVGQAKSDLLQAIVARRLRETTLDRVKAAGIGVAGSVVTEAESALEEADVRVISARQALVNLGLEVPEEIDRLDTRRIADELRFLGIPEEIVAVLPPNTRSANLYAVRAPYDGVIVASESVLGEVVSEGTVLYTVADPRRMWLTLAVPQEDSKYVRAGLPVKFRTDDGAQQAIGEISWVSPTIDQKTRTMQARVVLGNDNGALKDKTFGTGRILLREEPKAVVVPREAVQATSDATFIFVRDKNYLADGAPKVFHVRQVRVGASDDSHVELLAGALPGEVVATKGSNVLLSQLLRSNLGAGCGCHDTASK